VSEITGSAARYNELPRFSEIVADVFSIADVIPWYVWNKLDYESQEKKHFLDMEFFFSFLSTEHWEILKKKAIPTFKQRDQFRGWSSAFDYFNEAVAYATLTMMGFSEVNLREDSKTEGISNPDLDAKQGTLSWIADVKTINISDDEITSRENGTSTVTLATLSDKFLKKMECHLCKAEKQLSEHCSDMKAVFFVLNFDEFLHEYVDEYFDQICEFLSSSVKYADQIFLMAKDFPTSQSSIIYRVMVWPTREMTLVESGKGVIGRCT
jgi:hypothetical protein